MLRVPEKHSKQRKCSYAIPQNSLSPLWERDRVRGDFTGLTNAKLIVMVKTFKAITGQAAVDGYCNIWV
jgi:hypothetical protein